MNRPLDLPLISVDLSREVDFSIGGLRVCPSHRQVSANGQQETIQPRVMQVLVALARARGAVLSRDNLVETCWDGLNVGDDAINRCIAKVRQIAEFGGAQYFEIETIPRVGYRLAPIASGLQAAPGTPAESVSVIQEPGPGPSPPSDTNPVPPIRNRVARVAALAALAVLMVLAAGVSLSWVFRSQTHQALPAHREPLLAVLPFRNLSADAGSRYFSDGVTQEIIDALLRLTEIRVASPASSFALRDAGVPRFAKALAATHVLTGSVERNGDDLRVVAQLAEAGPNRVLWSRIYRTTVAETPALQHHIAVKIANALDIRLSSRVLKEAARIDPAAYDHYLHGRDLFRERHDIVVAVKELEQSVRLAPTLAKAWSTLAAVRFLRWSRQIEIGRPPQAILEAARSAASRALALDPNNGEALGVLAITSEGDRVAADRLFERALRAEPNNSQLLNWHHNFLHSVGRFREADDEIATAYDLDRLTPAIVANAAATSIERGNFERARQIIEFGLDFCTEEDKFILRAKYLLARRHWKALNQHLHKPPAGIQPEQVAFYRLAAETEAAIADHRSGQFATLRDRWRGATGDKLYVTTFLMLLGDTKGALKAIESAVATGQWMETGLLFERPLPALRRDPQAKALMAKWGFFEYWQASNHWPDFCQEPGLPFDCKAEARRLKS